MAGLGLLKGYSYLFNARHPPSLLDELDDVFAEPQLEPERGTDWVTRAGEDEPGHAPTSSIGSPAPGAALLLARPAPVGAARPTARPLDIFALLEKIEWDTLLFFYGVLLGVGGLGALGYLELTSEVLYGQVGATPANILVGVLSALVDNVPVMFAVLEMAPDMSHGQWLLVTLAPVDRQRGRRRADGAGARGVHLRGAPALELGRRARVPGQRRCAPGHAGRVARLGLRPEPLLDGAHAQRPTPA
jgi:hypothetical protein